MPCPDLPTAVPRADVQDLRGSHVEVEQDLAGCRWPLLTPLLYLLSLTHCTFAVVPSSAVPDLLTTIPLADVRGLGGKLGEAVLKFAGSDCRMIADLQVRGAADGGRLLKQPFFPIYECLSMKGKNALCAQAYSASR